MIRIAGINLKCSKKTIENSKRIALFDSFGIRAFGRFNETDGLVPSLPESARLIVRDKWQWNGVTERLEWYENEEARYLKFYSDQESMSLMRLSKDYSQVELHYKGGLTCSDYSIPEAMLSFQFRNLIIRRDGLILHASAIEVAGKAILFVASSGTGKSTHTALWEKYRGAQIFNDDSPAIRVSNRGVMAYGTPWSGTSEKYLSLSCPVGAIILLERGNENKMTDLNEQEAAAMCIKHFQLPYQDQALMDLALKTSEVIFNKVPFYRLQCTPDLRAVEAVENHLGLIKK